MINPVIYILRFIYKIKYWLVLCPLATAAIIYIFTMNIPRQWSVETTIYTGVVSGFDIESSNTIGNSQTMINNAMDNIINIITSESTLKRVSMRLYAQHMMFGDPNKDTKYISAANYRKVYEMTKGHEDVLALIDKTTDSDSTTVANLFNYEEETRDNFIYGLFNWSHQYYSKEALQKIIVKHLGNSDMVTITYSNDDPAVTYTTLKILNEEFIKQYEELRFGETFKVIKYFDDELLRLAKLLRVHEDSLTSYSISNQIINYPEQTKYVAAMERDFQLKYEEILLVNSSSKRLLDSLERHISVKEGNIMNNVQFLGKMNEITSLTSQIASLQPFETEVSSEGKTKIENLKNTLANKEAELTKLSSSLIGQQYSKEGVSSVSYLDQWLGERVKFEKSEAELKVMNQRKTELDQRFILYSPIGSTLKRQEREISFTEQSYLSVLNSLNAAKLRQKNLQMTSATLKVINPPAFPLVAEPHSRKLMVIGGSIGAFIMILGIFILLEVLDRTLKNKARAEQLTGTQVIGALPIKNVFRFRSYNKIWLEIAAQQIGSKIMSEFKPSSLNIINILSTENGDGKSLLSSSLGEYFGNEGLNVKVLLAGKDFEMQTREFHMSNSLRELYKVTNEDLIIVEYPALRSNSVPSTLLSESNMNIIAIRANRSWKDTDQITLDHLKNDTKNIKIVLSEAERLIVEIFTGLLPPYTLTRRLVYRIYQFGFTSVETYGESAHKTDEEED